MTANAPTVLAGAHPQPCRWAVNAAALGIQDLQLKRCVGGELDEERSVDLYPSLPHTLPTDSTRSSAARVLLPWVASIPRLASIP